MPAIPVERHPAIDIHGRVVRPRQGEATRPIVSARRGVSVRAGRVGG